MKFYPYLTMLTLLFLPMALQAESSRQLFHKEPVQKVGGNYKVSKISRKSDNHFIIEFSSLAKTGKHDVLVLESDHVHVAVEEGMKLRLSAEILTEKSGRTEVGQVLLFIPQGDSHVPIWLLSRNAAQNELRGSRYLEMHAPTSDYLVL